MLKSSAFILVIGVEGGNWRLEGVWLSSCLPLIGLRLLLVCADYLFTITMVLYISYVCWRAHHIISVVCLKSKFVHKYLDEFSVQKYFSLIWFSDVFYNHSKSPEDLVLSS